MSINPVSDIVLDVARAADPARSRAAAEKLSSGDALDAAAGASFSHVLANSAARSSVSMPGQSGAGVSSARLLHPMDARTKAYKGLEQLVLKNLLENMLPKASAGYFGSGTAGDIYRFLLADQLAAELTHTINLGIFNRNATAPNMTAQAQISQHGEMNVPLHRSFGQI